VKDRLPEHGFHRVFVIGHPQASFEIYKYISVGRRLVENEWFEVESSEGMKMLKCTHWAEIPELPISLEK
jgi:hypothetical protein